MSSNGWLVYASEYDELTEQAIARKLKPSKRSHQIPKTSKFPQFSNAPATPRLRSSASVN